MRYIILYTIRYTHTLGDYNIMAKPKNHYIIIRTSSKQYTKNPTIAFNGIHQYYITNSNIYTNNTFTNKRAAISHSNKLNRMFAKNDYHYEVYRLESIEKVGV